MQAKNKEHISVMAEEMLHYFAGSQLKVFFDGTLGAGGHAKRLLESHPELELYIGCDQDPEALCIAKEELKPWKDKVVFIHSNFSDLDKQLKKMKVRSVNGFFLT